MDFIFHEAELEERKERCQEKIMRYAAAGAVNGLNPVPGINVGFSRRIPTDRRGTDTAAEL